MLADGGVPVGAGLPGRPGDQARAVGMLKGGMPPDVRAAFAWGALVTPTDVEGVPNSPPTSERAHPRASRETQSYLPLALSEEEYYYSSFITKHPARRSAPMDIAKDIRDRITAAASALYEEAERSDFPTVAAVRSRAGVDMNAASIVMREWRRSQMVPASPLMIEVPEKVRTSSAAALASLWAEAQSLANESLLSAQAVWEAERSEAETLRRELSTAFDAKDIELRAAQGEITRHQAAVAESLERMRELTEQVARSSERAGTAEARAEEIERRADDLRAELERVHAQFLGEREKLSGDVARAQAELLAERSRSTTEIARVRSDLEAVRGELSGIRAKAEADVARQSEIRAQHAGELERLTGEMRQAGSERDTARKAASDAREEAARLSGKIEAMEGARAVVQGELPRSAPSPKSPKGSKE